MNIVSKLQPVFIIAAALLGLLFGSLTPLGGFSVRLIEPFLMVLLFFVFLAADGEKFKDAFKNLRFTLSATLINFVWTPLFSFGLGTLFFGSSVDLQMGLMMLLVTPCTDWYLVFTGLAKGNIELGASILPLNLLLQILLMPLYIFIFFGNSVEVGARSLVESILFILVIPFAVSCLLKLFAGKASRISNIVLTLKAQGDNFQLIFLCLAVVSMFASESGNVAQNPALLLRMFAPLALFFAVNFAAVRLLGRKLGMPPKDVTALNFTTLARNSPLSLAIAVAAFPERPLISLALVIGPLIELPALSVIAGIAKKIPPKRLEA